VWIFGWIVIPWLFFTNAFGNDTLLGSDNPTEFYFGSALNTPSLFANNGTKITAKSLIEVTHDAQGILRYDLHEAAYDAVKPIRITTLFAVSYCTSFMVFAAALVHVAVWYGPEIWKRLRTSLSDLDQDDIHAKLMVSFSWRFVRGYITED
jgi:hypothetical protein